jgi:DNA polymerase-3 subunit beta
MKEVSFCAATTDIKPEIASIYLYTKDGLMYSVATDSYRLAEKTTPNSTNLEYSFLIPQKHVGDIIQILQDEDSTLMLSKQESILSITTQNLTLSIHTTTGQFPDYRQLFPKEFTTTVMMSKEDLQKTLTLTTFFNENYSQVECIFTDGKVTFHSRNESIGQVTYTIPASKEGETMEVKYNNRYFLDVLSHIEGGTVVSMFTTPNRPMFIRGTKDISFTYLLMPLNR